MNDHPTLDQLRQWLDGLLSESESSRIESHLDNCGDRCPSILEELMRSRQLVLSGGIRLHNPGEVTESASLSWYEEAPISDVAIPGFEILEALGHGGMSIVYKARHRKLKTFVALKMILKGDHASHEDRTRFQNAAEAMACMQHPNIVQIHEIGEYDGQPYLSMELCEGGSLDKRLKSATLTPVKAAELVETLARAVQTAHNHKIVHRDLKPGNVLLTNDGTPKITDFDLAKKMDEVRQTPSGKVLGTPAYMAPEQADTKFGNIGPATDVYALGAILYECLTGRPPFKAATHLDTIFQVVSADPVPPSRLQPKTPRDLETISLKCLQKDPKRRYASAHNMAEDLRCWQRGEPIKARPVGRLERMVKWAKRQPAAAALIAVSTLAMISIVAGVIWYNGRLKTSLEETRQRELASRRYHYAAEMNLALDDYIQGRDTFVLARLNRHIPAPGEDDLRGFEWYYLWRLVHHGRTLRGHSGPVFAAVFLDDGRTVATAGSGGVIHLWNTANGQQIGSPLKGHEGTVTALAFSSRTGKLASAGEDKTAQLWDTAHGRQIDFATGEVPLSCIAFDPTGSLLIAGRHDGRMQLWKVVENKLNPRPDPPAHSDSDAVRTIAVSSDGKLAATGGADGAIKLWKIENDQLRPLRDLKKEHTDEVWSLAFSQDCARLASAGTDDPLLIWNVATGDKLKELQGNNRDFLSVAWSNDREWLATGGRNGLVQIWEAKTYEPHGSLLGHSGPVYSLAFSPDSRTLVSAAVDQTACLWDLSKEGNQLERRRGYDKIVLPGEARLEVAAFAANCRLVATADSKSKSACAATLWDAAKGTEISRLQLAAPVGKTKAIASSHHGPDGSIVGLGTDNGTVAAWRIKENPGAWQVARLWTNPPDESILAVAVSADGKYVAAGNASGTIRLLDGGSGAQLKKWKGHDSEVSALAFGPDPRLLASGGFDRKVKLWSIPDGSKRPPLQGGRHGDWVTGMVFSQDGRTLASASDDCTIRLWDVEKGTFINSLEGHAGWIGCLAFRPDDDKTLISGGDDLTIKLWDRANGLVRASLEGQSRMPRAVGFSADGDTLLAVGEDRWLLRWQAAHARDVSMAEGK